MGQVVALALDVSPPLNARSPHDAATTCSRQSRSGRRRRVNGASAARWCRRFPAGQADGRLHSISTAITFEGASARWVGAGRLGRLRPKSRRWCPSLSPVDAACRCQSFAQVAVVSYGTAASPFSSDTGISAGSANARPRSSARRSAIEQRLGAMVIIRLRPR